MWGQLREILNQSAIRTTRAVADFLPGVLAMLVILIVTLVAAVICQVIVGRALRRIGFDTRLQLWGFPTLADWSPSKSPSLLLARLAFWFIVVLGALVGLNALDAALTSRLVARLFGYFPDLAAAALILLIGPLVARFVARSVLISAVNMQIQSARLISLGVKWMVIVLVAAMALEHLGIGGVIVLLAFGILFGGIVLALALAVGLGSKDMVSRSWGRQANPSQERSDDVIHHP